MAQFRFVVNGNFVEFYDGSQLVTKLRNSSQDVDWFYDDAAELEFEIDGHKYKSVPSNIEMNGLTLTTVQEFDEQISALFPNLGSLEDVGDVPSLEDILTEPENSESNISEDCAIVVTEGKQLQFGVVGSGSIVFYCPEYANNAAALAGGLRNGAFYCTDVDGEFIVKKVVD